MLNHADAADLISRGLACCAIKIRDGIFTIDLMHGRHTFWLGNTKLKAAQMLVDCDNHRRWMVANEIFHAESAEQRKARYNQISKQTDILMPPYPAVKAEHFQTMHSLVQNAERTLELLREAQFIQEQTGCIAKENP